MATTNRVGHAEAIVDGIGLDSAIEGAVVIDEVGFDGSASQKSDRQGACGRQKRKRQFHDKGSSEQTNFNFALLLQ